MSSRLPLSRLARLPTSSLGSTSTGIRPTTRIPRHALPRRYESARGFASGSTGSTVSDATSSSMNRWALAGGLAGFVTFALLSNPISMDGPKTKKERKSPSKAKEKGLEQPSGQKLISFEEVEKHKDRDSCWVIIQGQVWDVTNFLDMHPGGAAVILANAGGDASDVFNPIHPPNTLQDNLDPSQCLGPVDPATVKPTGPKPLTVDERRVRNAREQMPPLEACINVPDIEEQARKVLSTTAYAYYESSANSGATHKHNHEAWKDYYFVPRVLRDASYVDTSTTMLGAKVNIPIMVSPAAMAKLGHPLGEVNITKAAGEAGIIQGISSNASCSVEEIMDAAKDDQTLWFQLYLNKDREASERLIQKVDNLGFKAILFTVDTPVSGFREMDVRAKGVLEQAPPSAKDDKDKSAAPAGIAQAISGYQDPKLVWDDIDFIKKHTKLPIILKGVQSLADAEIAATRGVDGIVLSNHGGRSLDYAPAPIDVLYEIQQTKPELLKKMEFYVDGGVTRGTDVLKALALGAKGVGLGRAFLYANGAYGQEGCKKICDLLQAEISVGLALLGCHSVDELEPNMVRHKSWTPPRRSGN